MCVMHLNNQSIVSTRSLYVMIPIYFCMLAAVAVWSYMRNRKFKQEGISDAMSTHYLGGRSFGALVTAGTMFASLFSGYTVVGVPNEAFKTGWLALRWMPTAIGIGLGYFGTGLRLRKMSLTRNHQSPVDFVTDRYQSQFLRYTIFFLQVLPSIIYLSAQVNAVKGTFNSIFGIDPDSVVPVIIIFALILLFEWAGGLTSVATTDAVQGLVMTISFIMVPIVILRNFGGWSGLDFSTYPQQSFYQTPSGDSQWLFWNFAISNLGFFSLPHLVQRTYAAESLSALKAGYATLTVGPWFTLFVSVFLGTMGVQILGDAGVENPTSPFAAIFEEIMNLGGFPEFVGVLAFTAALAAIMSTADSLIIAISQLITAEVIYPIYPQATPKTITWIGRGVSFFSTVVALLIGILWTSGLSDLGAIQFGISFQTLPTFIIGLFATSKKTDCHPWSLASGGLIGCIIIFVLHFGYITKASDPVPLNAGVTAAAANIIIIVLLESARRLLTSSSEVGDLGGVEKPTSEDSRSGMLFSNRPEWDFPKLQRFGERPLTPQLVWKSMEGVTEAVTNMWFTTFMLFLISFSTPFVTEMTPALNDSGLLSSAPAVFRGIPVWAFKIIMVSVVASLALFVAVLRMPNEFPDNDDESRLQGLDVDTLELTKEEMGLRQSYDARNNSILQRRQSVRKSLQELGINQTEQKSSTTLPQDSRRRLSELIKGTSSIHVLKEESECEA